MNATIIHRGPDDSGEYRDATVNVSLAMRRLSILDLEGGHQPLCNEDGTVWIVYNGEIFNAPELRADLEARGHQFRTANSDTEVLIHLYEEKGPDMLHDLNGMFAFAIHDRRRNIIFAARDRMGIKPLNYWQGGGRFALASELKSLLRLPFIPREVDPQSLSHYMTLLYVPDSASIIKGVCRLPAGHHLVYDLQRKTVEVECYWRPRFDREQVRTEGEWAELLRIELRQAVSRWTLSDVPIACSLSGGLDSSAIVGLLGEMGYPKIKTFSLGFSGDDAAGWNETALASLVAKKWGAEHHEIIMRPEDLLRDLLQMVWHLDEPYAGGLPSWHVFKAVGQEAKVCLTGSGGDELFGNYGKSHVYEAEAMLRTALAGRRMSRQGMDGLSTMMGPFSALANHLPESLPVVGRGRLLSRLADIIGRPFGKYYYANFMYMSDELKRDVLLDPQGGKTEDTATLLQKFYDASHSSDVRNGLAAVDFRTQLAEEFLQMTDRFSMAHSVEARVPFLDHQLVETVFQIPSAIRTRSSDPKYLLRKSISDLLPPELLTAPKRGFVIPIELWLRRELRPLLEFLLSPQRLRSQGLFRPDFYERFARPHLEGRATYTWQIWAAMMFQLWHFEFIEQNQMDAPTYDWKDLIK